MNKGTENNKLDETQLFPTKCKQLHPLIVKGILVPGLLIYIDDDGKQIVVGEKTGGILGIMNKEDI